MRLLPRIRWRWVRERLDLPAIWRPSSGRTFTLRRQIVWPWQPLTGDMMTRGEARSAVRLCGDRRVHGAEAAAYLGPPMGRRGLGVVPRKKRKR